MKFSKKLTKKQRKFLNERACYNRGTLRKPQKDGETHGRERDMQPRSPRLHEMVPEDSGETGSRDSRNQTN